MKFVAPVVLLLVLSGALYKTKLVYPNSSLETGIPPMSKEEAQKLGAASAKKFGGYMEGGLKYQRTLQEKRSRRAVEGYSEEALRDIRGGSN